MEAADPFAETGGAAVEDDPFAEPTGDPAAEIAETPTPAEGDGEPPVVNREGETVEPEGDDKPTEQPPEADPAPEPPSEPPTQPADHEAGTEPAQPAGEAAGATESGGDGQEAPKAAQPPVEPQAGTEADDKMRRYKVLYQTAERQWTEHDLSGVPEGVNVVLEDGEKWVLARNNDHMLRIAYAVLGSPENGVRIWPASKGGYKPKRVKPAAQKPERTRLEIG